MMNSGETYVYISLDSPSLSVFKTQVLTPLMYLKKLYPNKRVILFIADDWKNSLFKFFKKNDRTCWSLKRKVLNLNLCCLLKLPIIVEPQFQFLADTITRHLIKNLTFGSPEKIIIHTRGQIGGIVGIKVKRELNKLPYVTPYLIVDFRGDVIDEVKTYYPKPINRYVGNMVAKFEKIVVDNADLLLTISFTFKEILETRYSKSLKIKVLYPPTTVMDISTLWESREKMRRAIGIEQYFVITYLGTVTKWQNLDKIFKIMENLLKKKEFFFILLTPELDAAQKLLNKYRLNIRKVLLKTVDPSKIYKYISASDLGILYRDNRLLNKVSFPVKVAEYVSNGCPVIFTGDVGDLRKIFSIKYPEIFIFKDRFSFSEIEKVSMTVKTKRKELFIKAWSIGKDFFDVKNYVKRLHFIYQNVDHMVE